MIETTMALHLGIPAATLRGLRDGSLVAVPKEPTQAMLNAVQGSCPEVVAIAEWRAMLAAAQGTPHNDQ